jgi:succinate dehydrogenase / fumarate reductase cytochrome b subunit
MVNSSVGSKAVMAVTGLLLFGFVVAHMLGNLQVFLGPEVYNNYAHKMQSLGPLLWGARLGLLAIFVAHVGSSLRLAAKNRAARPERYVFEQTVEASFASRTMVLSGLVILVFVIYHLLHFTLRWTNAPGEGIEYTLKDGTPTPDVYSLFVMSFRVWYIVLIYIIAQVVLALHLSHGMSSVFQTLGWKAAKYAPIVNRIGPVVALIILFGNISMPIACFTHFIPLPSEISAGGMH